MSFDLRAEVEKAMQDCFDANESFTVLTITNKVRQASYAAGEGIVRHREVRKIIDDLLQNDILSPYDYDMSRITVNVNGTPTKGVRLYHSVNEDALDYADTNQTMWEPTGGWDKKTPSSRPIQMKSSLDDDDDPSDPKVNDPAVCSQVGSRCNAISTKVQKLRETLSIPQKIVNKCFNPNDKVLISWNGSKITISKALNSSLFDQKVDKNGRLRVYGSVLKKLKKSMGDSCIVDVNADCIHVS